MNKSKQFSPERSSKRYCSTDKNLVYNHKRICDLSADHSRTRSYTKMIIESYERLNKSQAIEFLQQASSTESKLSLLDAMKDKVTLSSEEIDELVPATDSSSLDTTEISSFDNLSHLSGLLIPQQPSRHILNSFNNAALSSKMSSKTSRRTAILRSLFGRPSTKRRAPIIRQPLRSAQREEKKRMISGGDQVKFSSTQLVHAKEPYQDEMHPQGDTVHSLKEIRTELQSSSLQGLRYDFKQIPVTSTVNLSAIKQSSKDNPRSMPFTSPSSFGQGESLLSLADLSSMRQQTKDLKHTIQSAHSVGGVPNVNPTNNTHEKTSFNAYQHKYHVQTPSYNYPKPLSTIELQSKQYPSFVSAPNSAGLFWYSANQSTVKRTTKFPTRGSTSNETKRFDSSSDSRDTSSSSSASSSTGSVKTTKTDTSSSSSNTSSACSNGSSSSSTASSSQTEKQPFQSKGQYNRNQNNRDDLIQIDLNSIISQTSSSTSTATSVNDDSSSSSMSTSSFDIITNRKNDTVKNMGKRIDPLTIDLFSSANNRTVGNYKMLKQTP